jgi:hypothetical protein
MGRFAADAAHFTANERTDLMKRMTTAAAAAVLFGAALSLPTAPASAQLAASPQSLGAAATQTAGTQNLVTQVRWRGRHGWHHRRHWHHRHGYYGPGPGAAIAGLAAGAIIGGAIASQSAPRYDGAIQYCIDRFKSYDIASQTYLGYDGLRHSCP